MRNLPMDNDITAKLYQCGKSREDAIAMGADAVTFDALEDKYQGGSIPLHEYLGFRKTEPYSCDYHTGGATGQLLRDTIKANNSLANPK